MCTRSRSFATARSITKLKPPLCSAESKLPIGVKIPFSTKCGEWVIYAEPVTFILFTQRWHMKSTYRAQIEPNNLQDCRSHYRVATAMAILLFTCVCAAFASLQNVPKTKVKLQIKSSNIRNFCYRPSHFSEIICKLIELLPIPPYLLFGS